MQPFLPNEAADREIVSVLNDNVKTENHAVKDYFYSHSMIQ